ncbi:MAG: DnaJ domain-containing protein [Candidatus Magnetobacterium sp. LHC-1]|uniref:DnaJ domain-containing protein n=1 Tax=Candidatus Magnetobacterium casense TaxID=1455061 RepID=A0ABS6RXG1_9BACT|nr:DnaJ domain-containing protein [Candidatus Magnetobacterium casensis]MBF0605978.1 DnaJ domain-containing protein [Nitrospirota bacterium]MBV6340943.1 DnaJ domain-containing protein [Candidatus Magnetobacterium casensis]
MTKDDAFKALQLDPSASKQEIEAAYNKLVRRYPPEFQPDKFREIDEAYRFLTSLSVMIERLLADAIDDVGIDADLFKFDTPPPTHLLEGAINAIKRQSKIKHLMQ